jgi:Endomembrane protein 70
VNSEVGWANRYDHYMKTESDSIHYLSLLASTGLIISLLAFVARSLKNVLRRDIELILARIKIK